MLAARRQPPLLAAVLLGLLASFGCDDGRLNNSSAFTRYWEERIAGPTPGTLAPEYSALTLDGDSLRLSELRGQVVLLNAWATWCAPCVREMPALQAVHDRYAEQGLRVVGVSVDWLDDEQIRAFLDERGLSYPVVRDRQHRLEQQFGWSKGIPKTLLIDRDGIVAAYWIGYTDVTSPEIDALIADVLARAPADESVATHGQAR